MCLGCQEQKEKGLAVRIHREVTLEKPASQGRLKHTDHNVQTHICLRGHHTRVLRKIMTE